MDSKWNTKKDTILFILCEGRNRIIKNINREPTFNAGSSRDRLKSSIRKWDWARYEHEFLLNIETPQYIENETEWLFGFISYENVSFDLYLGGKMLKHYDLEEKKFAPLVNSSGIHFIRCQLNCNNTEELLEIRNVQTTDALCQIKNEVSIFLFGGVLNEVESIKTQKNGIREEFIFVPNVNE